MEPVGDGHLGTPPSSAAAPDDDDDAAAPSELLGPLLEEWPDLLGLVFAHLDSTDCALLAQVAGSGRHCSPRHRNATSIYSI